MQESSEDSYSRIGEDGGNCVEQRAERDDAGTATKEEEEVDTIEEDTLDSDHGSKPTPVDGVDEVEEWRSDNDLFSDHSNLSFDQSRNSPPSPPLFHSTVDEIQVEGLAGPTSQPSLNDTVCAQVTSSGGVVDNDEEDLDMSRDDWSLFLEDYPDTGTSNPDTGISNTQSSTLSSSLPATSSQHKTCIERVTVYVSDEEDSGNCQSQCDTTAIPSIEVSSGVVRMKLSKPSETVT